MNLADLFSFNTEKQRKKRQKEYMKKVFRLGEEQREWEVQMVETLFTETKDKRNVVFELLVLKEKLFTAEFPEDEDDPIVPREKVLREWEKKRVNIQLKKKECAMIKAMALLQHDCKSLEELPGKEEIIALSEAYMKL